MFRGIHDRIALYKLGRQQKKLEVEAERVLKESKDKNLILLRVFVFKPWPIDKSKAA